MSSSLNDQRLQLLLDQKAQFNAKINAQIASIRTSKGPQYPPSSHGRPAGNRQSQSRRQDAPRSLSQSGSVTRTLSPGHGQYESIPMAGSISEHSAPLMVRFESKGSASSIPFSNTTGVVSPLPYDRRHNSVLDSYMSHQDDPVNDYTFLHSASQQQALGPVTELDYGEDPITYFARTGTAPVVSVTPSPIEVPSTGQWQNPHRLSGSSQRRQSFGITPATPSTTTLTTATTASEMSRENSYCSDGINGPFELLAVHSSNSFYDNSLDDTTYQSVTVPSSLSKPFSSEEQTLLVTGVGGASHNSFPIFHSPDSTNQVLSPFHGDMKRTQSNESSSSASSTKSRAVAQLQLQNKIASTRPLAPKAEIDESLSFKELVDTAELKSKTGTEDRLPITKAPYQRPKHDRVFCAQCTEYPDGFRGAHELGRHMDRQHKVYTKKWVCVEPSDGISGVVPINSLSKCKTCSNQKKQYNVYYNAAAHLRRAHFKPKLRGRSKSKIDGKPENRAGNGGGDWPSMKELKPWMMEISVQASENQLPQGNADDCDDNCDDNCKVTDYNDEGYTEMSMTAAPITCSNEFNFNDSLDSSMIEPYSNLPNYNPQHMHSMQFDLLPQQTIDTSMAYASSQDSFDSPLLLLNDSASFNNDQFPQSFDPSTTDLLNYSAFNHIM